jgi:hypothetical protein
MWMTVDDIVVKSKTRSKNIEVLRSVESSRGPQKCMRLMRIDVASGKLLGLIGFKKMLGNRGVVGGKAHLVPGRETFPGRTPTP